MKGRACALPSWVVAPGHGPLLSREHFRTYSQAFDALRSCSASPQTATVCARSWVDQVADTGRMTEQEKKLGQQMTIYFVTEVLRAHGGNSVYCAASAKG